VTRVARLGRAALPLTAIVVFSTFVAAIVLAAAGAGTLGHDYLAYDGAVRRFQAGGPLYDPSVNTFGGSGLFFYLPPFILLALPLTILSSDAAVWAFTIGLIAAFVATVALLPVSRNVRWATLLLGGLSWPLLYAIKLGQVGPILLLLFAIGWRWMDRPGRLGLAVALGIAIKIQPALLLGWAFVTGRRRAVLVAVLAFGALAIAATVIVGPSAWTDQASLVARASKPIDTAHSFTPGRLALEAGFSEAGAWAIQVANWLLCAALVLYALLRSGPVASYLAVVIASQLMSPILWDHYALVLLLPVAWLLERRQWWIVVVPLATSLLLIGVLPTAVYPISYWITLVAVVLEGRGERLREQRNRGFGAILAS
jgi:alpha-1,2-mannosyltransferase